MRGDQRPLDHRVAEIQRLPGGVERGIGDSDGDAHGEERGQPQQVGAAHPAALPPMADQQRRRQSDDDGLAEQPEDEQDEGEGVVFPPARFREAEPGRDRREVEQRREQVLALDHPGDGFDVQGWTANTAAMAQAPGTSSRPARRQRRTVLAACSSTLTAW